MKQGYAGMILDSAMKVVDMVCSKAEGEEDKKF
jgi:hypothetical protein